MTGNRIKLALEINFVRGLLSSTLSVTSFFALFLHLTHFYHKAAVSGSEISENGFGTFNPNQEQAVLEAEVYRNFEQEETKRMPPPPPPANYALDYKKALNLSLVEQGVSQQLQHILTNTSVPEQCFQKVAFYLDDYNKDAAALQLTGDISLKNVPDNPLLLYRMLRRILFTLSSDVPKDCAANQEIVDVINSAFSLPTPVPKVQDIFDALLGLLRIHYVYGFNATSELRHGIFGDVNTNIKMTFYDCLALANFALDREAKILAYQWMVSANQSLTEETENIKIPEEVWKIMSSTWDKLLSVSPFSSMHEMHATYGNAREMDWAPVFYHYDDYATCRGESDMIEKKKSDLICFLDTRQHPYFFVNPLKVEVLHFNPPILQFHEFIGERTMEYIQDMADVSDSYERSTVTRSYTSDEREFSHSRTSVTTWMQDDFGDRVDRRIYSLYKKMEYVTGFHVLKKEAADSLQIVKYSSLGAHYDFHNDALQNEFLTKDIGDRIATFFMFLSDVRLGGYTAFPDLGVFSKPIKGSAIIWFSLFKNGQPDYRNIHGGCPVVLGSKVGANKWIRQYENMWRYKCTLNPHD